MGCVQVIFQRERERERDVNKIVFNLKRMIKRFVERNGMEKKITISMKGNETTRKYQKTKLSHTLKLKRIYKIQTITASIFDHACPDEAGTGHC